MANSRKTFKHSKENRAMTEPTFMAATNWSAADARFAKATA